MRQLLPEELAHRRAVTIRWRLVAIAAKVVKTGRKMFVKVQASHKELLEQALSLMSGVDPPPI